METRCLIDWISITSKGKLKNGFRYVFPSLDNEDQFSVKKGAVNGYSSVKEHVTGMLVMSHPLFPDMGVHIIHNGTNLKRIKKDWFLEPIELLGYYVRNGATTSRIDIALDLFNSGISINELSRDFDKGDIETKAKTGSFVETKPIGTGKTLYVGSTKKRKKLLRVYDKGAKSKVDMDWIRIEYEIHGKAGTQASRMLVDSNDLDGTIKSIIIGFCNFPNNEIWVDAFKNVHPLSLRGNSEPIGDTKAWLLTTVTKSLAKMIVKDDKFLDMFIIGLNDAVQDEVFKGFEGRG